MNKRIWGQYPLYFILPAVLVYFIFQFYPVLSGVYYAFTDWNLYKPTIEWIGLENFKSIILNGDLANILRNTFYFAIITTILQNAFGLAFAMIVNQKLVLSNFARVMIFLPCILSPLLVGFMFSAILEPEGLFNSILSLFVPDQWLRGWLGHQSTALNAVIGVHVWQWAGFSMAIYLAGLQGVPKDLLEASSLEGAKKRQQFAHIIFPLLAPAITINIVLTTIGTLKIFDNIFVMTGGGPGSATRSVMIYIYQMLGTGRFGFAVAANLVLFVVILAIVVVILPMLRRREIEM